MRAWIKHKYNTLQLLIAAFQTGNMDEAVTQLDVLLGGTGEDTMCPACGSTVINKRKHHCNAY